MNNPETILTDDDEETLPYSRRVEKTDWVWDDDEETQPYRGKRSISMTIRVGVDFDKGPANLPRLMRDWADEMDPPAPFPLVNKKPIE